MIALQKPLCNVGQSDTRSESFPNECMQIQAETQKLGERTILKNFHSMQQIQLLAENSALAARK